MLVSPAANYGGGFGNAFGGDGWWIILLFILLCGNNGWGNGFGGGFGADGLYPWMNQSNQISEGFQNQLMNDNITSIRDGITGLASQFADCCCENRLGTADLKYTFATEECATRNAANMNTRDIIDSQTRGTQAILDKLCQLELDGVKAQVDAKNDRIAELTNQLNMANLAASQLNQNAVIEENIYSRLKNCPVPSMPVYGTTPIFSCNGGCGCSGNNF